MRAAVAILALAACGGSGDTVGDAGEVRDAPLGDVGPVVGTFKVSLVAGASTAAYTSLVGKIYDGVQPEAIVWETAASDGHCTLLTPRVPFCATPCGASAVCTETDTCKPYPTARAVGTVTATGLATTAGASSFAMEPIANGYQPPAGVQLAYPAFTEGDKFELAATGSAFTGPFVVGTRGVAALTINDATIALQSGVPLALSWPAPAATGSTIHVLLDISHHGGSKGKLECDLPDSGSASLDAGLITQLLGLGAAGYPTIIVTRATTGSAAISAGRVDLVASSTVERAVTIPGVISCTETSDCPTGQTCQADLTCQ